MFILNKQKGLTLIELLAVIAIIAILFVLLIPQISNAIEKSKEVGIMNDFRSFEIAAKSYFFESKNKDIESFNKFLDSSLSVDDNRISKKKNPFGNDYFVFVLSNKEIEIITTKNNKDFIYFTILKDKNNDLFAYSYGFEHVKENNASEIMSYEDFEFRIINNSEIEIVNYIGSNVNVAIPTSIKNLPVTRIAGVINDIDPSSFSKKNISAINFPNTLIKVGYQSFRNNFITNLELPNSTEIIHESAFRDNKIEKIDFPENLSVLHRSVFRDNNISSISLPPHISIVNRYAFSPNPLSSYYISSKTITFTSSFPSTAKKILKD